MKAVVLAAGEGRRLEPLTNRRPKPMLPVANRPLLEHVVEAVAEAGIDEIVLVVGYKRDRIQTHFGDGNEWGVSIEYVVQDKQLGTAHAVAQAESLVDDDFLVLNGDRLIGSDLVARLAETHRDGDGAVVAVTRSTEPSEYGVVELEGDRVVEILEKPRETPSDLINAGVYGFDPSVFDVIREIEPDANGEYTITTTIQRLIEGESVRALRYDGMWIDVSYLWDLVYVSGDVIDRYGRDSADSAVVEDGASVADGVYLGPSARIGANSTIRRGTTVGNNVTIGSNVVLENAVVFADAVVEDGAVLRDCVVASNATVGANVTVDGGDADVVVGETVHRDVTLGAVVGDNATIGAGSVLESGTVVGDDATVGAGTAVSGRISPGTEVQRG